MNNLGYFIGISSNACPYDPQELDTFRLVSKDTYEVATQNHLWSLFARSVGCDFLHSREDVKLYFADLKKVAEGLNSKYFKKFRGEQGDFIVKT